MAVLIVVKVARLQGADDLPAVDQGGVLFHPHLVFKLGAVGTGQEVAQRNLDDIGAKGGRIFPRGGDTGLAGINDGFVGGPQPGKSRKLADTQGIAIELGRQDRA